MTDKRTFILRDAAIRRRAADFLLGAAPDGYVVTVAPPTKRRIQEERYHAMIGDIARQCEHIGRRWDAESWKRLLIDEFAEEMRGAGTPLHNDDHERSWVTASLDGRRIVQLGIQSREFWVKEAAAFIEFLFAFGSDRGVAWSDESRPAQRHEEVAA